MDQNLKNTEFVRQYIQLLEGGISSGEAFESIKRMGYKFSQRTLQRHLKFYNKTGKAMKDKAELEKSGRKQRQIIAFVGKNDISIFGLK